MGQAERQQVLTHYLDRLRAGIIRTPLLNATPGPLGRGQKLDVADLDRFANRLGTKVIDAILSGKSAKVHPRWTDSQKADPAKEKQREADQQKIYKQMERYLIREASRIERETGNRSLWLGYPLVWVPATMDRDRSVLAPLFLFPVTAGIDRRRQLSVDVGANAAGEGMIVNRIFAAWLESKCGISLADLPEDEELPTTRKAIGELAREMLGGLEVLETQDFSLGLQAAPAKGDRGVEDSPMLYNAGVLGVMRWQN